MRQPAKKPTEPSMHQELPAIIFICTGNICRSPTAHALLMHKARAAGIHLEVDSAAISDEERGNPPDPRSVAEAKRRGIAMHAHAAR
jgi:protein-tyrosine phosphatase